MGSDPCRHRDCRGAHQSPGLRARDRSGDAAATAGRRGRAGTRRNEFVIFYFLSFSAFPNLFWLDWKPQWGFLNF